MYTGNKEEIQYSIMCFETPDPVSNVYHHQLEILLRNYSAVGSVLSNKESSHEPTASPGARLQGIWRCVTETRVIQDLPERACETHVPRHSSFGAKRSE